MKIKLILALTAFVLAPATSYAADPLCPSSKVYKKFADVFKALPEPHQCQVVQVTNGGEGETPCPLKFCNPAPPKSVNGVIYCEYTCGPRLF